MRAQEFLGGKWNKIINANPCLAEGSSPESTKLILENMNQAKKTFIDLGNPEDEVGNILRKFVELRDKNQLQGEQKDINWWVKQGFNNLKKMVIDLAARPTKRQQKLGRVPGERITLADTKEYTVTIPLTLDASRNIAPKSSFCTTKLGKEGLFDQYFGVLGNTIIYFKRKDTDRGDGRMNDYSREVFAIMHSPTHGITYWTFDNQRISNDDFFRVTRFWLPHVTAERVIELVKKHESTMAPYREKSRNNQQGIEKTNEQGVAAGIEDQFEFELDDEQGRLDVYNNQGSPAGRVEFYNPDDRDPKTIDIAMIIVQPKYRKQGLASTMYRHLKSQGYKIVKPTELTPDGKKFYDKLKDRGVAEGNNSSPFDDSISEASGNWEDRRKAAQTLYNLYMELQDGKLTDLIQVIKQAKELLKISGRRGGFRRYYTTRQGLEGHQDVEAGLVFDAIKKYIDQRTVSSGQAIPFPKGSETAKAFIDQLALHFKAFNANVKSFPSARTWTMSGGGRVSDPKLALQFTNEEDRDNAWEEISKYGKKVYIKGSFRNAAPELHIKIGKFVLIPGQASTSLFGNEPSSEFYIYVQSSSIMNNPLTPKVDITDQQAASLQDIAATKSANALAGIKAIMAVLQGQNDVKRIISQSQKIAPQDKAKLDAIISGAANFKDDSGV